MFWFQQDKAANKVVVVCWLHYINFKNKNIAVSMLMEDIWLNELAHNFSEGVKEPRCIDYLSFTKDRIKLGLLKLLVLELPQNFPKLLTSCQSHVIIYYTTVYRYVLVCEVFCKNEFVLLV